MGNRFICMAKRDSRSKENGTRSKRFGRSQRKLLVDEEAIHRQALAMAIQHHQSSQRFDAGSMSRRLNNGAASAAVGSTSRRRRQLSDPFSNSKQGQEFLESLKVRKFVLVHGEGFGAWCWYKSIALLEESGLTPVAIDLSGSGIDSTETKSVATLEDYAKPLISYIQNLSDDEKIILVGHGCGGASVSYCMENFPEKISKAIFICATMVASGQRPFDAFKEELGSAEDFMQESKFLIHGNGTENPPTGFMLEKEQMKALYFNQSTTKDIALAMVLMRAVPLGPIMERLCLSPEKYGATRRFYVQTLDDRALSPDVQEKLVRENPPEQVFTIKGSDHCPFFSKPQSLHKILLEIAQKP
ncbi:hypothetical protein V2J09_023262 [Rumex salicifolius]